MPTGNLLSNREMEILKRICDGLTDGEMAAELSISTATVRTHRKAILKKLKINKTVLMVRYALENKII